MNTQITKVDHGESGCRGVTKLSPSKQRYKEAVNVAREHAYSGKRSVPPKHFDDRQIRIYTEKYAMFIGKCSFVEGLLEDMAMLHGHRYTDEKILVKISQDTN